MRKRKLDLKRAAVMVVFGKKMDSKEISLECLKMAKELLPNGSTIEDIIKEAKKLAAFIFS